MDLFNILDCYRPNMDFFDIWDCYSYMLFV